jgi:hypothetical protein
MHLLQSSRLPSFLFVIDVVGSQPELPSFPLPFTNGIGRKASRPRSNLPNIVAAHSLLPLFIPMCRRHLRGGGRERYRMTNDGDDSFAADLSIADPTARSSSKEQMEVTLQAYVTFARK